MKNFLSQKLAGLLVINMFFSLIAPPIWAEGVTPQVMARHHANITSVTGTVEVKVVGTTSWVPATVNREVKTGDNIRTAAGAKCKVKVADVGDFDIGSATEVAVGNLQQVKTTARAFFMMQKAIVRDDVGMDLKSGDMRSGFHRIEGRVGNYSVSTPVAVAGVRGTQFELDLDGGKPWYDKLSEGKGDGDEEQLTATVLEGDVHLSGPNWDREVLTGQQLVAIRGQIPSGVKPADDTRLQDILNALKAPDDKIAPAFGGATSATRFSPSSVKAQWAPANDDSTTPDKIVYDIYAATSSASQDFNAPTATTAPGAAEFTLTGLNENANYFIVVRARDEAGNRDANTKEVSTGTGDMTAPAFTGATSAVKTTTTALVTWSAASDNVTPAEQIVYDIHWSTTSGGQSFTTPSATTAPGVTSFTATDLEALSDYYFVVRARDAAGNRDANTKEVTTAVEIAFTPFDTFDTNAEIVRLTQKLFDDYALKSTNDFMSLISPSFAGVNNSGNALTAISLGESLKSDFNILSTAVFGHSVTSITPFGGDRIGTDITWDARYHFTTVDTEVVQSGLTTNLLWDASSRPFQLVSWTGAAPFGLTVLSSGSTELAVTSTAVVPDVIASGGGTPVATTLPPPVLASLSGPTAFDLTGVFQDFAPVRVILSGTDFQNGARVEESGDGGSTWNDVAAGTLLTSASVFFTSSSELDVDFSRFLRQYYPDMPSSFTEYFRVVNPDAQISAAVASPVLSQQPGPLNLTTVSTDRPVTSAPDPTPYNFTLQGFNIVTPGSVAAGTPICATIMQSRSPVANFNVVSGPFVASPSSPTQPMTLTFDAQVGGGGITPGSYDVQVTDARGQSRTILNAFTVTAATTITWSTPQTLSPTTANPTGNYTVPTGVTLNVNTSVTGPGRILVQGTFNAGAGGSASFTNAPIDVQGGTATFYAGTTLNNSPIDVQAGTATLTNTTLQGSASFPGISVSSGNATITGGSINTNLKGVYASSGSLSMNGTSVSGNSVAGIYLDVSFPSCTLSNLSVSGNGVGLINNSTALVDVTGGNYADGIQANAGTIRSTGSSTITTLEINNTAALDISGASNTINGLHTATSSNGAINITGASINAGTMPAAVNIDGSGGVTISNTAMSNAGGDGILITNSGTVVNISGGSITARRGIYITSGTLDVTGTTFSGFDPLLAVSRQPPPGGPGGLLVHACPSIYVAPGHNDPAFGSVPNATYGNWTNLGTSDIVKQAF